MGNVCYYYCYTYALCYIEILNSSCTADEYVYDTIHHIVMARALRTTICQNSAHFFLFLPFLYC